MALLEAQAAGLPLVAGDRAGTRQIVADGETALLAPAGDAAAFAAAVAALLDAPARRTAMAAAAIERVRSEHDLPIAARRLDAVLRDARAARLQTAAP
jgi:glycosyltransferase involved in cell wall biosynthesis